MPETIRREHDLAAVRIGFRSGKRQLLTFRLDRPNRPTTLVEVDADDVLAADVRLDLSDVPDALFRLPANVLDWLDEPARELRELGQALWLDVTLEHALLPLIPWEGLFGPLGVPILRLPNYLSAPRLLSGDPVVAVWLSVPPNPTPGSIRALARDVLTSCRAVHPGAEVHVFTDAGSHRDLRGFDIETGAWVHDPRSTAAYRVSAETNLTAVRSEHQPWLEWFTTALNGRSVDVLHLVGHGFLSLDQGGFCCSAAPTQALHTDQIHCVWVQELTGLMSRIGAWGALVSAVPDNVSTGALRLLAGRLSDAASAPTVHHQVAGPTSAADLRAAYELLLDPPADAPADTTQLSITIHPNRIGVATATPDYAPGVTQLSKAVAAGAELPAWAVSAQRQVEQWQAQLSYPSQAPQVEAMRGGLELAKARLDAIMRDRGTTT